MPTWLTVTDLARRLGRPESTIRSWRDRYPDFVPEQIDSSGRRTYPSERFAEIQQMQADHLTPREIRAELARRHGGPEDGCAPSTGRVTLESLLTELREIRALVDWLVEREKERLP